MPRARPARRNLAQRVTDNVDMDVLRAQRRSLGVVDSSPIPRPELAPILPDLPPVPSVPRPPQRMMPSFMGALFGRMKVPVAALMIGALGGCASTGSFPSSTVSSSDVPGIVEVHAPSVRLGSTGKFAFDYDGGDEAFVTFRTYLDTSRLPDDSTRTVFADRLRDAVDGFDSAAFVRLTNTSTGAVSDVDLRFRLELVDDPGDAHKKTVAYPGGAVQTDGPFKRIASVSANRVQLPVDPPCNEAVFAHEVGHVFGMPDEYEIGGILGFFHDLVYGETKNTEDHRALMNTTCDEELRPRYFAPFAAMLERAHAMRNEPVEAHVVLRKTTHD